MQCSEMKCREMKSGRYSRASSLREDSLQMMKITVVRKIDDFLPLERMFCAAPTMTANIRGVVPILAVIGAKKAGKRFSEKNMAPVTKRVTGVMRAATPQPNFCINRR